MIIYDDKKLGSGAFGSVFLGKLIGQAKGSKDARSTLGVNLMRAENCQVAVKMLPRKPAFSMISINQYCFRICGRIEQKRILA